MVSSVFGRLLEPRLGPGLTCVPSCRVQTAASWRGGAASVPLYVWRWWYSCLPHFFMRHHHRLAD